MSIQRCVRVFRGFTIIELLIVLAVLIAIGALVAPAMWGALEERALDSAADVASEQLMLARAHAQSSGRPVEVICRMRNGTQRIIARYFEHGLRSISEGDHRANVLRGETDIFAERRAHPEDDADDDSLTWSWADRALPVPVALRAHAPPSSGEDTSDPIPPTIRIAVFMPDGSALFTNPVWLSSEPSRAIRLEVNPWTGLPRSEAVRESASASAGSAGGPLR